MAAIIYDCDGRLPSFFAVAPTTAATPIVAAAPPAQRLLVLFNNGSVTVYVGGAAVTALTGQPVAPGDYHVLHRFAGAISGITASGTGDLRVVHAF